MNRFTIATVNINNDIIIVYPQISQSYLFYAIHIRISNIYSIVREENIQISIQIICL